MIWVHCCILKRRHHECSEGKSRHDPSAEFRGPLSLQKGDPAIVSGPWIKYFGREGVARASTARRGKRESARPSGGSSESVSCATFEAPQNFGLQLGAFCTEDV